MTPTDPHLNPAEAAERLGVSAKALRLYEERNLLQPARSAAGWRAYGPREMARAAEIVALRSLGLSLAGVARVLKGEPGDLEPALAAHQASLEARGVALAATIEKVRDLRASLRLGKVPASSELRNLMHPEPSVSVAFDLPWPWGGERFDLTQMRPITYLVGPLGSGKTRLARRIAAEIPGAAYVGSERLTDADATIREALRADPNLGARVDRALQALIEDGATANGALVALLAALAARQPTAIIVDMVEDGLNEPTQQALIAHLRDQATGRPPLVLMTRSSAILDLAAVGPGEAILHCPANHSPPMLVSALPGAPGLDAVASCLAPPHVRLRTQGVTASRPTATEPHPS